MRSQTGSVIKIWDGIVEFTSKRLFGFEASIYSKLDASIFRKLATLPAKVQMVGRARVDEVAEYFYKYRNSMHKVHGWAQLNPRSKELSQEVNTRNYRKCFRELTEAEKAGVFKVKKDDTSFTFYFVPMNGKLDNEEFKRV